MERIYIIEDETNIRDLIKITLESYGYQVTGFENAEEGLIGIQQSPPDLIIFDWMLPGMDGTDAIRQIRNIDKVKNLPIMILTAKDKELDKVVGLDVGADDYMTKPFSVLELGARVRSLLRRAGREVKSQKDVKNYGNLSLNKMTREVWFHKKLLELTFKEYELLCYLIEHQGKAVSREELLNAIWGYEYDGETRTLDIHIRTLRQKLGEEGQEHIKTIRGVGYRFMEKLP